jgi:hypothetical protein
LYERWIPVNDKINIYVPTVGEIIECEDDYYSLVSILTAMPIDFMVQLDDLGIDFTSINEYDLLLILFPELKSKDTSMIFGDLDLSGFELMVNQQNNNIVLRDELNDITIDRSVYSMISNTLRKIHSLERDRRKPANEEAKKFMLERARKKLRRNKNKYHDSQLESFIISLVNAEQFKYDFEGTRELSIYQFNVSVRQIIKKTDYEHLMFGVYSGSISAKDVKNDELIWLYKNNNL